MIPLSVLPTILRVVIARRFEHSDTVFRQLHEHGLEWD